MIVLFLLFLVLSIIVIAFTMAQFLDDNVNLGGKVTCVAVSFLCFLITVGTVDSMNNPTVRGEYLKHVSYVKGDTLIEEVKVCADIAWTADECVVQTISKTPIQAQAEYITIGETITETYNTKHPLSM